MGKRQPEGFDVRQPAILFSNRCGDAFGDIQPFGRQVDVERDEGSTRADNGGTCGWMWFRWAEVRSPLWLRHFRRQPLELAAPDVLEPAPTVAQRGFFVQKNRYRQTFRQRLADITCQLHAF